MLNTARRSFLKTFGAAGLASALAPAARAQEPAAAKTRTRFAINCEMWFGDLPFPDRIRAAADLGFDAVEFWPWRGKDRDAVTKAAEERGVEIAQFTAWGFVPGMNDPANHAAFVKEVEESCKVAKEMKVRKLCVVGGNDRPGVSQKEMHAQITAALKLAAPVAETFGVMLILEPMNIRVDHKGHCLYGSPEAVRICREVDSPMVKINWDLYHMHISEGDLCGHLREGFDQLGYVQVADHPGRNEPGTGEIHYPRVMRELWDLGYRDLVGVECSPLDGDDRRAAPRVRAAGAW
jgi:hydroxypyruvate isomerase